MFLIAALLVLGMAGPVLAFHSGGVANCVGCHKLHNAKSASGLLVGTDVSSTCLTCHGASGGSGYHISTPEADMPAGTPPGNRTPGGDFGWLKKSYTWSPRAGTIEGSPGDRHGHNIVAADFGYTADATNLTAPGGNMEADLLSCNSCHDNHGKLRRTDTTGTFVVTGVPIAASGSYADSPDPASGRAVGAYRLLRGPGSAAGTGGKTFTAIFHAVVPSTYNRSEETTPTRVAYGEGISDWCATCHPDMHSAASSIKTHPVNEQLSSSVVSNYDKYQGSGIMKGHKPTSFDSIVPFGNSTGNNNTTDYSALKALTAAITGPDGNDRVTCLSCHRAHASGWSHMTRWNNEIEYIAIDGVWPGTDSPSTIASQAKYAQGRTVAETTRAYNDTTMHYAFYQRSLCNKCHAKD